ncbi:MAG: type III-B CRISPR module-associated Cmr3 family protein [Byssovorax sp.]
MTGFMVRPVDWVSFGPPRPSAAGESHRRSTQLPPTPTTFQGIVRTALLRASGIELNDRSRSAQLARDALVGLPDRLPAGWQLQGPFITEVAGKHARPWVASPRFLLQDDDKHLLRASLLSAPQLGVEPTALNDLSGGKEPVLVGHPEAKKPAGGWLSPRGLRALVSGVEPDRDEHCFALPIFIEEQHLPGLAIDPVLGTAEDGMLYFNQVLRFAGSSGLAGWLRGSLPGSIPPDALTRGDLCTCGYKSRPAVLEGLPDLDPDWLHVTNGDHLPKLAGEADTFFLVALTPIPIPPGDRPAIEIVANDLALHGSLPAGVSVRVLAALTGRPRVIGGIEAASRRTRPNRSYWEAGSAFLFELSGGSPAERAQALRSLNNTHPLGSRDEASFGYGHTLVAIGETKEGRT